MGKFDTILIGTKRLAATNSQMNKKIELTAVIEKEDNVYISLCPEMDIASQGETPEEAKSNLIEALELFYETASENEISKRLENDLQITKVTVSV